MLRDLGARVAGKLSKVKPELERLWLAFDKAAKDLFEDVEVVAQADLAAAIPRLADLAAVDKSCQSIMSTVPEALPERRRLLALLEQGRQSLQRLSIRRRAGTGCIRRCLVGRTIQLALATGSGSLD